MLKKKLNFDDDVLIVIENMNWSNDGTEARIEEKLDRKMYTAVNKALEAMGGKWNTKAKAHLFPEDPRSQVEGLLETGTLEIDRDGFFPTPDAVIDRMFEIMPVNREAFILEPSCGNGAIVIRLLKKGVDHDQIVAVEINPKRAEEVTATTGVDVECEDFMLWDNPHWEFDQIYMNPPFEEGQDAQHVINAYAFLAPGGELISVMSPHAFFAKDSRSERFRNFLEDKKYDVEDLPEGSFKSSGTGVNAKLIHIKRR
jgi:hypothetical protein